LSAVALAKAEAIQSRSEESSGLLRRFARNDAAYRFYFFLAVFFFVVFFAVFRVFEAFFGTFLPSALASDNPIAIACLRLVTFLPERPLFSVPALRFFITRSTSADAFFEYLRAIIFSGVVSPGEKVITGGMQSSSPAVVRLH
jgi:hypothetical protein